jgi:hypothetical protein
MLIRPSVARIAVNALLALVFVIFLPWTRPWLESLGDDPKMFEAIASGIAVVLLFLVAIVWLAAVLHLQARRDLGAAARGYWSFVVYGLFIFGALAYYWTWMRTTDREGRSAGPAA